MPAKLTRPASRRATARTLAAALVLGLSGGTAPAAFAQGAGVEDPGAQAALRSVIERQLQAFLAGDVETAWGFASPAIQGLFGSVENFGRMVEQGYPMVWAPSEWRFGEVAPQATPAGPRLRQSVILRDASGAVWIADYLMMPTAEGWLIDGVSLRRPESTGV